MATAAGRVGAVQVFLHNPNGLRRGHGNGGGPGWRRPCGSGRFPLGTPPLYTGQRDLPGAGKNQQQKEAQLWQRQ